LIQHIGQCFAGRSLESTFVGQKTKLNNTLTVHLADMRQLEGVRQTLEQFKDCLGKQTCLSPHHGFLVNPEYVAGLKPRQTGGELYYLQLKGREDEIPVARLKLNEVKSTLESC
jgi:DNA-binding LytR/AlgR family response regulator